MPAKKPSQEKIESVKTRFQVVESKVLDSNKEKFFRLPYGTALEAIDADLSKTAYRLWIYLSANYPFGDCDVELPSQTELGIRLGVSRQAINIAAAEIQAVGLWDFWADKWKGRNLKGYGVSDSESVKKNRQVSKKDDTVSKKDDTRCQKKSTPCQKKSTPCQKKSTPCESEPLPNNDSSTPQTIQTYSDFIKTLSEEERESFLEFGKKKASQMPEVPGLPLKWIKKNFEDIRSQWFQTRDENKNQNQKYNFAAYSEPQHQMWYRQLQTVVVGTIQSGDRARLEQFLRDDFYSSWFNWAKTAREDVREFLASNPIPTKNPVKAE